MSEQTIKSYFKRDPRDYQLMVLASMLLYGLVWVRLERNITWILSILTVALIVQYIATRIWKLPVFEWRSALISGLSLSILMKTSNLPSSLVISLVLSAIAILSKFIFRWNNKHIFNPTNFALVLGILGTSQVSVVPGQWGNEAVLAFFIACMGIFVANKACRSDVSYAFFTTYAAGLLLYTVWTGGHFLQAIQNLQAGSLLIFAFFMISDPKSTPDSRMGRLIFSIAVALVGIYLQLAYGIAGGLLISLALMSLTTPLLDRLFPGERFQWHKKTEAA